MVSQLTQFVESKRKAVRIDSESTKRKVFKKIGAPTFSRSRFRICNSIFSPQDRSQAASAWRWFVHQQELRSLVQDG